MVDMSFFEQYRDKMMKVYGQEITREWWDAACRQPRWPQRRLSDTEFDYNHEADEGWTIPDRWNYGV
jgi:hypothetical protein